MYHLRKESVSSKYCRVGGVPSRRNSKCKGPEVGGHLANLEED